MDEVNFLELLRGSLTVDVYFKRGHAYWDDNRFVVRILWDGEEVSKSSVSVPNWEEKRGEY